MRATPATKRQKFGSRITDSAGQSGTTARDPRAGELRILPPEADRGGEDDSGASMMEALQWLGIAVCLTQSGMFSGLNLAVFSTSRLRLEAAAAAGDKSAKRVLALRQDANFTLVTILWGNIAVNVLLTMLADSVLAGVLAFLFSTVFITIFGEIVPQAYFSRHALRVASGLAPLLRFYQVLLWPFARPFAKLLDAWVGPEAIPWFREEELRGVLVEHARHGASEIGRLEATGAANFLALDDLPAGSEGERLDPRTVLQLPVQDGRPLFPPFERSTEDPFLRRLEEPGKRWAVIVDEKGAPRFVLDAHRFLTEALFGENFDPVPLCHRPLIVDDEQRPLGKVLARLTAGTGGEGDGVIDKDVILVWTPAERRIITGADILGCLLHGIVRVPDAREEHRSAGDGHG